MTIEAFIDMTQNVVADDGLDDYLPTLVLPSRPAVLVLQEIADGVEAEKASREWMAKKVGDSSEDYFLAFRVSRSSLKVVARIAGMAEERLVQVRGG